MRVLVAASVGLALALPGTAAATVGSLDFRDCVSSGATTTGCTNVSGTTAGLDAVTHALAISGDGRDVYTAGAQDAVVHLARDPSTGALAFKDCIAAGDSPALGCTDISATTHGLESPVGIVMTRDDRDVYVAGLNGVAHLVRDGVTGALTFADCISSIAAVGCTVTGATTAVGSFDAIRLGSDDHQLYASGGSRVVHLTRSVLDGSLLFTDCLSGSAVTGCTDISGTSNDLSSAESLAPSADGRNLYVGSDHTVYNLTLNASGTPAFGNCLASSPTTGCTSLNPSNAFDGLENVAISPDGENVYVTGELGGLSTLHRDATTGTVTFDACIASLALTGCTDVSATNGAFTQLDGITVSPDGRSVYTAGGLAAAHLVRDPATGQLTPADCVSLGGVTGCRDISGQTNALADLQEITISPAGDTAYVAAELTGSVLQFRRQLAPACSDATVAVPHDTTTTIALTCTDANGDALTRAIASGPGHGTLGAIDQGAGTVAYTPATGFTGADAFTFTAGDGRDQSPPATASLTTGTAPPATRDTTAPVLTRLSAKATRRKRGGTVRFTLSERASVSITIQRKRRRRFATVGTFKKAGAAGANRKAFGGKLARRKLKPGRYRVRARATDAAGNRSKTRTASFRVRR